MTAGTAPTSCLSNQSHLQRFAMCTAKIGKIGTMTSQTDLFATLLAPAQVDEAAEAVEQNIAVGVEANGVETDLFAAQTDTVSILYNGQFYSIV